MRTARLLAALAALLVMTSCGLIDRINPPPTAESVCAQIVEAGVGTNCRRVTPGGLNARARERYDFDLPSVPGEGGAVMLFETDEDYDATLRSYAEASFFAGPHRYGNREHRIFVQFNQGASVEVGDRARALIEGL